MHGFANGTTEHTVWMLSYYIVMLFILQSYIVPEKKWFGNSFQVCAIFLLIIVKVLSRIIAPLRGTNENKSPVMCRMLFWKTENSDLQLRWIQICWGSGFVHFVQFSFKSVIPKSAVPKMSLSYDKSNFNFWEKKKTQQQQTEKRSYLRVMRQC